MFVDKALRRKKDSIKCLKAMADKIKERANVTKKPAIRCYVAENNKPAQKLYKKMNFKEYENQKDLITMHSFTDDFAKDFPGVIKKLEL